MTKKQIVGARYMSRNGRLRIAFHQVDLPDGVHEKLVASLEGIQAGKQQGVKLDSDGGAEATSSKSRYALTSVSVGLAAVSFGGDRDALGGNTADNSSNRIAGGLGGRHRAGRQRALPSLWRNDGTYGAGISVYGRFIARGHDVIFPKNTAMQVSIAAVPAAAAREMPPNSQ